MNCSHGRKERNLKILVSWRDGEKLVTLGGRSIPIHIPTCYPIATVAKTLQRTVVRWEL